MSVSWSSPFAQTPSAVPRGLDWQLTGLARIRHCFIEAWRLHRSAHDVLLADAGMEVYFLCLFSLLHSRRITVYDFLRPRARWAVLLGPVVLWRVNRWLVIRRADAPMLSRRFRVSPDRCRFVPYPGRRSDIHSELGDYVYAAGIAHRDWPTFVAAMALVDVRAIVSSEPRVADPPPNVLAREILSPEEGRRLAARARIVVVPMQQTELPSGPTVVVDAQTIGKAVIATDVGGTRDYIEHGVTGWLVPARDARALADQIAAVIDDPAVLRRVGAQAQASVAGVEECFELMLKECLA